MNYLRDEMFLKELTTLLNKFSMENGSDTPDFILADYLLHCLQEWNITTARRDVWHEKLRQRPEGFKSNPVEEEPQYEKHYGLAEILKTEK